MRTTKTYNISKSSETKQKFNNTHSLDEQWTKDYNNFLQDCLAKGYYIQATILLINTYIACIIKNIYIFSLVELISIVFHALAIIVYYYNFKQEWIDKHY